jgi:hypothetical protein
MFGENFLIKRRKIICSRQENIRGDQMKGDEKDGACAWQGTAEKYITGFGEKTLKQREHLGETGLDGIIEKPVLKK